MDIAILVSVMNSKDSHKTQVQPVKAVGTRAQILRDLLNVTWLMLTPTVVGIIIGAAIDKWLNVAPVGFLLGAVLGFSFGIYAIMKLLARVKGAKL